MESKKNDGPKKRLVVMRHAKSSWSSGAESDHDRPLNNRGRRDAPQVAQELRESGWAPEFVLSSNARRTRETFAGMQPEFSTDVPVQFVAGLYLAGYNEVVEEAAGVAADVQTLLVLGHNPGWEGVVAALSGEQITMKTANAALLQLATPCDEWQEALRQRGQWQLVDVLTRPPKSER